MKIKNPSDLLCKSFSPCKGSMEISPFSRGNKRGFWMVDLISSFVDCLWGLNLRKTDMGE